MIGTDQEGREENEEMMIPMAEDLRVQGKAWLNGRAFGAVCYVSSFLGCIWRVHFYVKNLRVGAYDSMRFSMAGP